MAPKMESIVLILLTMGVLVLIGCDLDGGSTSSGSANGVGDSEITIATVTGVKAPVLGETPVTAITETDQFTGTVTWDGGWTWSPYFGGDKAYTATITLMAKSGYTLTGVGEDFFTVDDANSVSNDAGSGVITAGFPATASVSVGDEVLGGVVAYILRESFDDQYVAGEQRGLIAATEDQEDWRVWALTEHNSVWVTGTGGVLGTGSSNTDKIIAQNGTGINYAAGLARAHDGGGYDDWYLPSQIELGKLYSNKEIIGGFNHEELNVYWSSTETYYDKAYYQNLTTGDQTEGGKAGTCRVRAVRSF